MTDKEIYISHIVEWCILKNFERTENNDRGLSICRDKHKTVFRYPTDQHLILWFYTKSKNVCKVDINVSFDTKITITTYTDHDILEDNISTVNMSMFNMCSHLQEWVYKNVNRVDDFPWFYLDTNYISVLKEYNHALSVTKLTVESIECEDSLNKFFKNSRFSSYNDKHEIVLLDENQQRVFFFEKLIIDGHPYVYYKINYKFKNSEYTRTGTISKDDTSSFRNDFINFIDHFKNYVDWVNILSKEVYSSLK